MCSCDVGFTCWRCQATPFDDGFNGTPISEREFASMTSEPYVYLPPEPFYAEREV